jgi:hypothetical protein
MKYKEQYESGKEKELRFVYDYTEEFGLFNYKCMATEQEDRFEHWDVLTYKHGKIDVKKKRKIKRHYSTHTNQYVFELQNVLGKPGWGYGKADFIAYEQENVWELVLLKDLQEIVENSNFEKLTRIGRRDVYSWIPNNIVLPFVQHIIPKNIYYDCSRTALPKLYHEPYQSYLWSNTQ